MKPRLDIDWTVALIALICGLWTLIIVGAQV